MDRQLARRVGEVILKRWSPSEGGLASEVVYADRLQAGVEVPHGAMEKILEDFIRNGSIRASMPLDREAFQTHGGMVITWVNPRLL
jgi:hypothetical protein